VLYQKAEELEDINEKIITETRRDVKVRIGQDFFRRAVLSAYEKTCCLTGMNMPELLRASHIIPWSKDEANRVNPRNGLCLNAIHDRAFDRGLLTITPDLTIKVSKSISKGNTSNAVQDFLLRFDGSEINKPTRFLPEAKFLKYHNKNVFRA
jgi:predicted restriction endonuclease